MYTTDNTSPIAKVPSRDAGPPAADEGPATPRQAELVRSIQALERLLPCQAPAQREVLAEVIRTARGALEAEEGPLPTWWVAPGFDSLGMVRRLAAKLNGPGGHIEQIYLYLDHLSAAAWCALMNQADHAALRAAMPLHEVAAQIILCAGPAGRGGLDVIALGPGDGKSEVRLVRHLLQEGRPWDLRLYLLDSSQPLLNAAYLHAADTLSNQERVTVFALQGDFCQLPRSALLSAAPPARRRLLCMFGCTFSNLEDEARFLRTSLRWVAPGDLLLLDVGLSEAAGRLPPAWPPSPAWQDRLDEWLAGPIRRYVKGVKGVELRAGPSPAACTLPGSSALELSATVKLAANPDRRFSLLYMKRYEEGKLIDRLWKDGWEPMAGWRYGESSRVLYLLLRPLRAGPA